MASDHPIAGAASGAPVTPTTAEPADRADQTKRLQIALDATGLGTWFFTLADGTVTFDANAQLHYGVTTTTCPVADIMALVHPDDRERIQTDLNGVFTWQGTSPARMAAEHRIIQPRGYLRYLRVLVQAEFDPDVDTHPLIAVYGTTQDVTDVRHAQRTMADQALLLREVGEIAKVGGWEYDLTTGTGTWTPEGRRIHGASPTATLGREELERFEGEARARLEGALRRARVLGTPFDLDLPFTTVAGEKKWIRGICRPVIENGTVTRLRGTVQDITDRKIDELALSRFVKASPAIIYALDVRPDGLRLAWVGGDLERQTGWKREALNAAGWWYDNLHPDDRERVLASNPVLYETGNVALEYRFRRPEGTWIWIHDERNLLRDEQGRPIEVVGSWTDVTARVELTEQLRQAQKLEALGQLSGGIAHDFNNLLTVILGSGDLLAGRVHDDETRELVEDIRSSGARAAALTRQLLTFSRKEVLQPAPVDVNAAIDRIHTLLQRLIDEDVTIVCRMDPTVGRILIDPGQFEQVIINLAVNARDAMPHGGTLMISSDVVHTLSSGADARASTFVRLMVRDNGIGMRHETLEHIFEPFFTTKPAGRGTGLGLATVFGIVTQSGGHIDVQSTPGTGTTFIIDFPQLEDSVPDRSAAPRLETGRESILVVDDDDGVRRIATLALQRQGYDVTDVDSARRAIDLMDEGRSFDLLLTDVVMPDMSGPTLAATLRARNAALRVLFMSGYVHDTLERQGLSEGVEAFLYKPFTIAQISTQVRELLDQR